LGGSSRIAEKVRPTVSVVMPTYNRAGLIMEAVASVVAQTCTDWELLVVDDGSDDDTVERLAALREPRLRILEQSHHGNVARVRNIGARAARGRFLAFLDSDDLWLPGKLERQLRALDRRSGSWCYAAHELVDTTGTRMPLRAGQFAPLSGRINHHLLRDETAAAVITWLIPRGLFERLGGFDESLTHCEDLDLALRLSEEAKAVAVDEVLALVREHQGRTTRQTRDHHRKTSIVFDKAAARARDHVASKLARRRAGGHLACAGEQMIATGSLVGGIALIGRALLRDRSLRRCVRSLAAGVWRRWRWVAAN
jgi:glycosyltransferase involved in cell wall biosynthesis